MKCFLCFLNDDFHADLRAQAQSGSARHERALTAYKNRFIKEFKDLSSADVCPRHRDAPEQLHWWVDRLAQQVQKLNVSDIFERLIKTYETWISGRLAEAGAILDSLLRNFDFDNRPTKKLDKVLFFRGRQGNWKRREELFHIPFSKRFCISSQRYSLAGQPLLYLGLSVLDVVCEFQGDPLVIEDCSFSYFWLRQPEKVRVLDTSNELRHIILNNVLPIIQAGVNVRGSVEENPSFDPKCRVYSDSFVTFVISSVCSFKRNPVSADDKFAPEYVLPQLIAAWARSTDYDGILYSSTRIDTTKWRMKGSLKLNRYRENVAFFTSFNPASDDEHDVGLLNRFEISDPMHLSEVATIPDSGMQNLRKAIIAKGNAPSLTELAQTSGIDVDIVFNDLVFVETPHQIVPYSQTDCGRLQRQLQWEFMCKRLS